MSAASHFAASLYYTMTLPELLLFDPAVVNMGVAAATIVE
jgi:hypothetical protein